MNTKSKLLKVNVCSLAEEARIIRREEVAIKKSSPLKGNDPAFCRLNGHRRWELRNEARAAQLLYGFVRGVPYEVLEKKADWKSYSWTDTLNRLSRKCKRFGVEYSKVQEWIAGRLAQLAE